MARVPRFYLIVVVFLAGSVSGLAGTLSMNITCADPLTMPPVLTSFSRSVDVSPPFNEDLNCPGSSTRSAFAFSDRGDHIEVWASAAPNGEAYAEYRSLVQVTFEGGVGEGSYAPCLLGQDRGPGTGDARFGIVRWSGTLGAASTCIIVNDRIRFTFGVPQIQPLFLSAHAVGVFITGPAYGTGTARFDGFRVFDVTGTTELPGVTWTAVAIPEPRMFGPMLAVLAIGLVSRRLSKKRRSKVSRIASSNPAQLSC